MKTEQLRKKRNPVMVVAVMIIQIFFIMTATAFAQGVLGETTLVSVNSAGMQGNAESYSPSISADGRFVAFESYAENLVAGDTFNNRPDVFVHDRQTGQTTRASVNSAGIEGNAESYSPSISADGRYVAFSSYASNLVAGDTNGRRDVFVHDRQTGQTTRASVNSAGIEGNGSSSSPAISADGRYVAFSSSASNLVAGDTNETWDVFVHDRQTGQTTRVSVDSTGIEGNADSYSRSISADGRYVAFVSEPSYLVAWDGNFGWVFVHDRQTGQTTWVSSGSSPSISAGGRYVAFSSGDIFVHDRQTGQTTRVSVNSAGIEGNGSSYSPAISADGRYVAFWSEASNLVAGDTNDFPDVFVHDRQTGQTTLVSVDSAGTQANNGGEYSLAISADGRYVAFSSYASNLVAGDTNDWIADIFVHNFLGSLRDPTPDAFTFLPQTDVPLSTARESNTITVSGINVQTSISITGGEYRIGSGAWTSALGTVANGQTVTVRQTSAATMNTQTTTVLTIGGVSGGFSVTTLGPRVTLTPTYLRFVEATLDTTTAPQTVTVTNSGSAPLIISDISLPASSDFAQTNNCPGGEIVVGGFCTIEVTFTPTANGIRKGPLTIVSDGAGSPHLEPILGVGGTGRPPQEIGIYRNGWYYLDLDGSRSWGGCLGLGGGTDACFTGFGGLAGDIPIVGDWTGDGINTIGIYRNGWWYLDLDGSRSWSGCPAYGGGSDACFTGFGGMPEDIPIVGDWTGDGIDKIGIYRNGWYYLDLDGSRSWSGCPALGGGTDACFTGFGGYAGDIPIVGDWNGGGADKIGIYRNGWYYLDLDNSRSWSGCPELGGGADACFTGFGGYAGDIPIVGDWIGDGIDRIGIYRSGWYYLDLDGSQSWSGCPAYGGGDDACFIGFGGYAGDIPIVGMW